MYKREFKGTILLRERKYSQFRCIVKENPYFRSSPLVQHCTKVLPEAGKYFFPGRGGSSVFTPFPCPLLQLSKAKTKEEEEDGKPFAHTCTVECYFHSQPRSAVCTALLLLCECENTFNCILFKSCTTKSASLIYVPPPCFKTISTSDTASSLHFRKELLHPIPLMDDGCLYVLVC